MLLVKTFLGQDQQTKWRLWGWYHGYPECCIEHFVANAGKGLWADYIQKFNNKLPKLYGSGFVCCPDCLENKTAEQLTAEIAKHRHSQLDFPQMLDYNVEVEDLVEKYNKTFVFEMD